MQRIRYQPLGLIVFLGLCSPIGAEEAVSYFATAKLTSPNPGYFGEAVAIDGEILIVGQGLESHGGLDSAGAAYVFERDLDSGEWLQVARLTAPEPRRNEEFGFDVAISSDTVVVGGDAGRGRVYIFRRDSNFPNHWNFMKEIEEYSFVDIGFGNTVSISVDTMVAGHRTANQAYVYYRDLGGPDNWGKVATLDNGFVDENFGFMVAVDGDTIAVTAPAHDLENCDFPAGGMVALFERDLGGPDAWGRSAELSSECANAPVGLSVAIRDDLIASTLSANSYPREVVSVFRRDFGGPNAWGLEAEIEYQGFGNGFGEEALAFGDGSRVIGFGDESVDGVFLAGSAYIYEENRGGRHPWKFVAQLTPPDGPDRFRFGRDVAVSGDDVLIGTFEGKAAYVYARTTIDPQFEIAGSCPGTLTLSASGGTPRAEAQLWVGTALGGDLVPEGCCDGTRLGLDDPEIVFTFRFNGAGQETRVGTVGAEACGRPIQVVDKTTCAVSEVVFAP